MGLLGKFGPQSFDSYSPKVAKELREWGHHGLIEKVQLTSLIDDVFAEVLKRIREDIEDESPRTQ